MNRSVWVVIGIVGVLAAVWAGYNLRSGNAATIDDARWIRLEDAFTRAKQENKKVLIDVYTDWCGWCKKMDKETYSDSRIQKLLDEKFLTVKLNAESDAQVTVAGEKMSQAEFAKRAGVSGYPTTLFFDEKAGLITGVPGYFAPGRFSRVLTYIGDGKYLTMKFDDYIGGTQ